MIQMTQESECFSFFRTNTLYCKHNLPQAEKSFSTNSSDKLQRITSCAKTTTNPATAKEDTPLLMLLLNLLRFKMNH